MPRKKKTAPKKFKLPGKVPVFPLPNVLLFPKTELPLYIFEPRYRKMLADALAGSKCMAISLLKKGWEEKDEPYPSHSIVSVGFIKAVVENPDGTSHILLKGVERARIVRYLQMEPYRIAQIRLMPDRKRNPKDLKKQELRLRELFMQKLRLMSENPNEKIRLPRELQDAGSLSHLVSFVLAIDPYLKQDILETTSVNCRVKHLISLLEEEIYPPGTQN